MQNRNFLLFFAMSLLILVTWVQIKNRIWPPQKPAIVEKDKEGPTEEGLKPLPRRPPILQASLGLTAFMLSDPLKKPAAPSVPTLPQITADDKLIPLGSGERDSHFHLKVLLDPRGAGVRSVILNKFQEEDNNGRPVWLDEKNRVPKPLELINSNANALSPSFLLYLYSKRSGDERPLETLGQRTWTTDPAVITDVSGRKRQSVSFHTDVKDPGLRITKTFSLLEGEYHLGLEVKLERQAGSGPAEDVAVRYQLAGPHGLPIEGKWFTSVFRNALIAREEGSSISRDLQDLRQISIWDGGNAINREKNLFIRYAGIAIQYFASVIVVDNEQESGVRQDFLARARPTLELALLKGQVTEIDPDGRKFILKTPTGESHTVYLPKGVLPNGTRFNVTREAIEKLNGEEVLTGVWSEKTGVAVTYFSDSESRLIATDLGSEKLAQPLFTDDITVRVTTEPAKLGPGQSVVHKYLLYNGPIKPMLLGQMTGDAAVPTELVNRYVYTLHLNTLTDYHSPGWLGSFASTIYWTDLIIKCTNLMHWVLDLIHQLIPSYGLCIILLTVLVRGIMFPISRKQALTSLKMQALAPEIARMKEKYKDDKQAAMMAQMELFRKHNISMFGSCWFILLQMPIFMGLYFALQESIFFRLAEFWPTWILNLAAPDMLWRWGESIPILSRPEDYGGMLYLGPYLNLLPIIAVTLMIFQQKMMTPPPTDDQQAMQQKIMKYMMIFFGLLFYKVAAGLCIYFIASSVWGFAERRLLPKFKPVVGPVSADGALQARLAPSPAPSTAVTTASSVTGVTGADRGRGRKHGRNKKRDRSETRTPAPATPAAPEVDDKKQSTFGRIRSWIRKRRERMRAWWENILKEAEKKQR
jgi:YidC/Oxa1 family membrane protein insertase